MVAPHLDAGSGVGKRGPGGRVGGDDRRAECVPEQVKGVSVRVRGVFVPRRGLAHALAGVAAVLIRRIWLGGPAAAVRRLACGLGPAPSFGGPVRDEGVVGSGEPAQGGGLAGERLIVPAR